MGRFDGPRFAQEGNAVVSVWLALPSHGPAPDDYFEEDYGDDEAQPFNRFSGDFGFGYYDHDFAEGSRAPGRADVPVAQLIAKCSYAEHFAHAVAQRAHALGIAESSEAYLMYEFAYDPQVTGVDRSACLRFIGVFPYLRR